MVSRKERTAAEVRAWLSERDAGLDDVEEIISRLEEALVIDDERFASEFTRDKREISGWGRARIGSVLAERGISSEMIDAALADGEEGEVDRACELLGGRSFALGDPNDRKRALGYLGRKGYLAEDAYEAVRRVARDEGLDLDQ